MTETQKILLQLIKELDSICREHGITYYFIGGSALGAVRHHGFIPWDDDADIVMDYWNYMKFISVMNSIDLPPNRDYSDAFLPPHTHTNIFGRYSSTDSTQIFDGVAFQEDNNNGVKVDVFMLIPCPDEGPERDDFMKKFHIWAELGHPTARSKDANPEDYLEYSKRVEEEGIHPLRKNCFEDLDVEKYKHCKQYLYCYEKFAFFYDKDIFQEPLYFPFEDTVVPVPTKYQKHFRILFGDDWATIPDVDGQITHRTTEDLQRSYTHYTRDYMRFKKESDFAMRRRYKYRVLKYWQGQKEVDLSYGNLKSVFLSKKYQLFWERNRQNVIELYESGSFSAVLEKLRDYTEDQVGTLAQTSNMFIEAPEEMIFITISSALFISKTKMARRLLRFIPEDYPSKRIAEMKALLVTKDEITLSLENNENDSETLQLISLQFEKYPQDRTLALWKAEHLIRMASPENDRSGIEEAKSICNRYADDGEFLKLLGDIARIEENLEEAQNYYQQAVLKTDNGFVLQSIEEMPDMNIVRPEVIYHG